MKRTNKKLKLLREDVRLIIGSYSKLAKNLKISRQSVYNWSKRGLPMKKAFIIAKLINDKYTIEELIKNW